jgi:hypothetical protein
VRYPKILNLSASLQVKGVHLLLKKSTEAGYGAEQPLATEWASDNWVAPVIRTPVTNPSPIPTATAAPLDPDAQALSLLSSSDQIAVRFEFLGPGSAAAAVQPNFASITANILRPKCLSCHTGAAPSGGGIDLSTYPGVMSQVGLGADGKPSATASPLYISVVSTSGRAAMPPTGSTLSTVEQMAISSWISGGALNND